MKKLRTIITQISQVTALTLISVAFVSQPSLASQTITYPATGATFEVEAASTDAIGISTSQTLNRLILPQTEANMTTVFDFTLTASRSGAVLNPVSSNFGCWFWNGATSVQTSGNYSITLSSATATTTTCRMTITSQQTSASWGEFRFGIDNSVGNYGRVGYTFGIPSLTLSALPSLSISQGGAVTYSSAVWSNNQSPTGRLLACQSSQSAISSPVTTFPSFCRVIYDAASTSAGMLPLDLNTAYWNDFGIVNGMPVNNFRPVASLLSTHPNIIYLEQTQGNIVYTASVQFQSASTPSGNEAEVPPPVYYAGPKVSSFVPKAVSSAPAGEMQFVGKRMNKITSASIGGLNATMIATRNTLEIRVPEGLAAGTYDLVLQTTSGRLTIIRFVNVR